MKVSPMLMTMAPGTGRTGRHSPSTRTSSPPTSSWSRMVSAVGSQCGPVPSVRSGSGHGVDAALARAALDGASDFFRLPLAEKQRARRVPGTVSGYTSAHADRFASKLPWKETLSFGFHDGAASPVVVDYFAGTLGRDFEAMG